MKNNDGNEPEECGVGSSCLQPYQCGNQYKIQPAKVSQRWVQDKMHVTESLHQSDTSKNLSCTPFGAHTFSMCFVALIGLDVYLLFADQINGITLHQRHQLFLFSLLLNIYRKKRFQYRLYILRSYINILFTESFISKLVKFYLSFM